ncbi:hypothetical protein [Ferrimicrobium sp.]|uniref:hypothetical protein n=1 Tax=Ferrimicrobium sp. TaxID=2926050 RepID=UPI00262E6D2C|nr:hypothetical protein [Ferrimicrobium sp.]
MSLLPVDDWNDLRALLAQGGELAGFADYIAESLCTHLGQDWLADYKKREKGYWLTAQLAQFWNPRRWDLLDLALSFDLLRGQKGMESLLKQLRNNPSSISQAGVQIRLARLEFRRSSTVSVEEPAEHGTWKPDLIVKVEGERAMRVECRKLSIGTKALEVQQDRKQPFDPWTRIGDALHEKAAQVSQDNGWICMELDDGSFGPNGWMTGNYVGRSFEEVAADIYLKVHQFLKASPAVAGVVLLTRPDLDSAHNSAHNSTSTARTGDVVSTISIAASEAHLFTLCGSRASKVFVVPARSDQVTQVTAWRDLFSLDPSWTEWASEELLGREIDCV